MTFLYALLHDELSNPIQNTLAALANVNMSSSGKAVISAKELEVINERIIRLADITKDLKSLAMLETKGTSHQKKVVDLAEIVQGVILMMAREAEKQGVKIIYQGKESDTKLLGNGSDLFRIVKNLIDNSIKYSHPEADDPVVIVSLIARSKKICLHIEDNGLGMSTECLKTLGSKPQLKCARTLNKKGSGMGWLLIKGMVELHKGLITVDSSLNNGTKVLLEFPSYSGAGPESR